MSFLMIFLALLPAGLLLWYIYSKDKIEKEPAGLLTKIFLFGLLSTVSAVILETIGDDILMTYFATDSVTYVALKMFLVVALSEELGKYLVVKKIAWKHPAFNYTFDAVVYAVFASLGFAALENIFYLMDADISTAFMRGILSVPGHAIDAVFMGNYFGMAKRCEVMGKKLGKKVNLQRALWVPVLTHGFYDFCLEVDLPGAFVVFLVYEVIITIFAFKKVNKLSAEDTVLFPGGFYPGHSTAQQLYMQGAIPGYQPVGFVPVQNVPVQNVPVGFGQNVAGQMQRGPVGQVQQPQNYNYDPMTGQPIVRPRPQYNFDPMTGQPIVRQETQND